MTGADKPNFIAFPPITAYGDGGFRIDGARHEGSVLIVNGEIFPWEPSQLAEITDIHLTPVIEADPRPELLLLGVGERLRHLPQELRAHVRACGIALEAMDTGAACRVYATLLSEGRHIAAGLIAVD